MVGTRVEQSDAGVRPGENRARNAALYVVTIGIGFGIGRIVARLAGEYVTFHGYSYYQWLLGAMPSSAISDDVLLAFGMFAFGCACVSAMAGLSLALIFNRLLSKKGIRVNTMTAAIVSATVYLLTVWPIYHLERIWFTR